MSINCFTLDYNGLSAGFELTFNKLGYSGRKMPIHLAVGDRFVQRDKFHGCTYEENVVHRAVVASHTGASKEFYTLQASAGESGQFLVVIDTSLPARTRLKVEPLRSSFVTTGHIVERDGNQALVALEEGQSITVFFSDGKVLEVVSSNQSVKEINLAPAEMAEVWLAQARSGIEMCSDDERGMKKRHGIIWNLLKLLQLRPSEAVCGNIMDFLRDCKESGFLSRKMREAAKEAFLACGQSIFALEISVDEAELGANVVRLQGRHGAPKEQQAKKAARVAADREFRNRQKGPNNGQKGQKKKA